MSDISTLKEKNNTQTFHLLLLAVVTGGIYLHIWLYRTFNTLEEVTRIKTMSSTFFISYLVIIGTLGHLSLVNDPVAQMLSGVLMLIISALSIIWSFRARRVLKAYALAEHNFELRMNGVYTVLFTYYYINYCINDLPRAKQEHEDKQNEEHPPIEA